MVKEKYELRLCQREGLKKLLKKLLPYLIVKKNKATDMFKKLKKL